ncbi:polyprenyl synthetase family protein [Nonomuraea sp. SBT364]|uniref:polyprenyl synthetase family protein n=1 Tax=Nonomuraea sp. SBT364 TaxID=1580530 RepID=UPI00066E0D0B|nr:polyprenyl synthetase family protein [Nonomuraea sp. SBT364]
MNAGQPVASGPADEAISRCRRLLEPALREAVSGLHPWGARMAAFTLGWSDVDGRPADGDGGKHLRPAVAMLAAEAAGASLETGLPGAVAVELVHAFSLVHDDIMDLDEQRRHRQALWKAYGVGPALLAGDALLALAVARLAGTDVPMRYLSRALVELVQGQTRDLAFESRPWLGRDAVTVEEYEEMAAGKTGSLLGAAAAHSVALGGKPELAERAWEMGCAFGVAFQIYDDVLGIWGDPAVTGKPVHGDLRRGKKTLPVLAVLSAGGPPARELALALDAAAEDEDAVRHAARLVEHAGGRRAALDLAARHAASAMDVMAGCLPGDTALRALCLSLIGRIG